MQTPLLLCQSQVSRSPLPGLSHLKPGQDNTLQWSDISQGLDTGMKLSSPNREISVGELLVNTQPAARLLIFISASNLCSLTCQLQLNVAPLMIPHFWVFGEEKNVSC